MITEPEKAIPVIYDKYADGYTTKLGVNYAKEMNKDTNKDKFVMNKSTKLALDKMKVGQVSEPTIMNTMEGK